LWHELWQEGLEEASRQFFSEKNHLGMLETLEPLHNMIEAGASTLKEQSFVQVKSLVSKSIVISIKIPNT